MEEYAASFILWARLLISKDDDDEYGDGLGFLILMRALRNLRANLLFSVYDEFVVISLLRVIEKRRREILGFLMGRRPPLMRRDDSFGVRMTMNSSTSTKL